MKKVMFLILVVSLYSTFCILSFSSYLPYNALSTHSDTRIFKIMPQGWAFFTRSPRESQIQLLKILPDGKLDKVNHYHAHYSNAFGTNRKTTMLLTQLSTVYKQIPDSLFKDSNCNIQYDRYFSTHDSITTDIELKNEFDIKYLSGEYYLLVQDIIPWAWTPKYTVDMPCKFVKIAIN